LWRGGWCVMNEPIDVVAEQIHGLRVRARRCRRVAGAYPSVAGAEALERQAAGIEAELERVVARLRDAGASSLVAERN
jgi:CHAD domain-containing protein